MHQFSAQLGQAGVIVVIAQVGARVGAAAELVVANVGEAHIAHAALGPQSDIVHAVAQRVGVFHADERNLFALLMQLANLVSGGGQADLVGVGAGQAGDGPVFLLGHGARFGVAVVIQRVLGGVLRSEERRV